jgi:hypothetical protein
MLHSRQMKPDVGAIFAPCMASEKDLLLSAVSHIFRHTSGLDYDNHLLTNNTSSHLG